MSIRPLRHAQHQERHAGHQQSEQEENSHESRHSLLHSLSLYVFRVSMPSGSAQFKVTAESIPPIVISCLRAGLHQEIRGEDRSWSR